MNFSGWSTGYYTHCLLQLLLDFFQTTDIVPSDGRHFDDGLAECRRVGGAESKSEILHRDIKGIKYLHVNGIFVKIDKFKLFTNLLYGGF